SAQAEIDTQPVLEIHADEVKAAHGATVGQLDEHALFYLRSRGIPFDAARRILVAAFCDAAFARLDPPVLRERIARHVASRLPGTPAWAWRRRGTPASMPRACARISRCSPARSTASRWSISTARTPRRSRLR